MFSIIPVVAVYPFHFQNLFGQVVLQAIYRAAHSRSSIKSDLPNWSDAEKQALETSERNLLTRHGILDQVRNKYANCFVLGDNEPFLKVYETLLITAFHVRF
jgi:hypothetical protein